MPVRDSLILSSKYFTKDGLTPHVGLWHIKPKAMRAYFQIRVKNLKLGKYIFGGLAPIEHLN